MADMVYATGHAAQSGDWGASVQSGDSQEHAYPADGRSCRPQRYQRSGSTTKEIWNCNSAI